jgi:hypothetical protein
LILLWQFGDFCCKKLEMCINLIEFNDSLSSRFYNGNIFLIIFFLQFIGGMKLVYFFGG